MNKYDKHNPTGWYPHGLFFEFLRKNKLTDKRDVDPFKVNIFQWAYSWENCSRKMYAECEQNDLVQNGALFNFDKSSDKIPHISFELSEFINKSLAEGWNLPG